MNITVSYVQQQWSFPNLLTWSWSSAVLNLNLCYFHFNSSHQSLNLQTMPYLPAPPLIHKPCPLPASQVHQVDDGSPGHVLPRLVLRLLCEGHADNGVCPAAGGIHVGGGNGPVLGPLSNSLLNVFVGFDGY